jgi:hypothetical protein
MRHGSSEEEVAEIVAYTTTLRIAQFNTRNEFTDWDTALHTFTFANAVHQGLRRISTAVSHKSQHAANIQLHELTRGIFDAAMGVYLNRFLNIPPAPIPNPNVNSDITNIKQNMIEEKLSVLLDKQQQVDAAAQLVADYCGYFSIDNNNPESQLQKRQDLLMTSIGRLLLREDRSFHLIQMIEAAFRQYSILNSTLSSTKIRKNKEYHFILAAVRYLAAHSPTMRSQTHTYQTAVQLSLGRNMFE